MKDRHLDERQFFVEIEHRVAGTLKYPGTAYQFTNSRHVADMPAPLLGEHTRQILESLD